MPFSLTEDDIKKQFKGAEFQGFDGVEQQDKTINLKFKKVTIADLAASPSVKAEHIMEAIGYRNLDRSSYFSFKA